MQQGKNMGHAMSAAGEADLHSFLDRVRSVVDNRLDELIPTEVDEPTTLHRAMRYSVFAGGKRLRPALVYAAALCSSGSEWEELPPPVCDAAAAVELVHTYSLIHDDLPCMDDDDVRRGKPTNHKVFGEAVAVLAGDALLTLAFEALTPGSAKGAEAVKRMRAANVLARAAGSRGMVGGQVADIEGEGAPPEEETLDFIQQNKTAALIAACLEMGAVLIRAKSSEIKLLTRFGGLLGLAFQTVDDILGEVGESRDTGKPVGTDTEKEKMTAVRVLGLDGARARAQTILFEAKETLSPFGAQGEILRALADHVVTRNA